MLKRQVLRTASICCLLALSAGLGAPALAAANTPKVQINTSAGVIEAELYADKAPRTVENFLQYVKDKHYDGTVFHRVIANFMVQGGGYDTKYEITDCP